MSDTTSLETQDQDRPQPPNPAAMTAAELDIYIKRLDKHQRDVMKLLRAMLRLRWAEEAAERMAKGEPLD